MLKGFLKEEFAELGKWGIGTLSFSFPFWGINKRRQGSDSGRISSHTWSTQFNPHNYRTKEWGWGKVRRLYSISSMFI